MKSRIAVLAGALALALVSTVALAATSGSNFDSSNHTNHFGGQTIIDAVAVPADSPIANNNVKNNGNVKVATEFLVDDGSGNRRLIFQATDGTTKSRNNIAGARNEDPACLGLGRDLAGHRFDSDDSAIFSDDGALLASEAQVREKGNNTPWIDVVIVWDVIPNGNSGGDAKFPEVLCMDTLQEVDTLRTDSNGGQYLIVGSDAGQAVTNVVSLGN